MVTMVMIWIYQVQECPHLFKRFYRITTQLLSVWVNGVSCNECLL